jgi:hypothetical protein
VKAQFRVESGCACSFGDEMKRLGDALNTDEIRRRLAALSPGDRALWGTMSAGAMVCHLREAFRLALGEWSAAPVKMPLPGAAVKLVALYGPARWPKNLQTVPELKVSEGSRPGEFAQDHAELCGALERFVGTVDLRSPHPIFGAMTAADWMRWGYLHTDHHLRQFGR